MRTPLTTCAVLAWCCVLAPATADAELVRVPVGAAWMGGVPHSFEECVDRIERAGYDIAWMEQPYYDPYYTATGGATYAYASLSDGRSRTTADVSWMQFDDEAAVDQQVRDMLNNYGPDSYVRFASDGVYYMQVYAYSYDAVEAGRIMDHLMGASR